MKIKRSILFIIFILALCLQACGPKEKEENRDGGKTEDTEDKSGDKDNTETPDKEQDQQEEPPAAQITINEQVLYEKDDIRITATAFSEDEFLGPEIKLLIENNSTIDATVQAREVSVNGLMIDPTMSSDVAAGKKANDSLAFFTEDLEQNAIDKIAVVELRFSIFNTDTFEEIAETDTITILTSVSDSFVQTYDDSGDVIYEKDKIRIIEKGILTNELFGPELRIYIENNSEKNITVQAQKVSVNGFMVEPIFSSEVSPGKKRNDGITFLDLEDDIVAITQVELSFVILDTDSFEKIDESDTIEIKYD